MSKFVDSATTAHTLSLMAMEEASRFGQRTADIDHMFLALTVNEQPAGQVLRGLGITLEAAREAVAAQHAAQLASLGITAEQPQGKIVFHETGGYTWGERPIEIIKRAGAGEKRGDASAVLRELVIEPSGMIEEVLERLGTTPRAVLDRLDEVERLPMRPPQVKVDPASLSGTSETFVPAAVSEVWALLSDPARMPEWDQTIGSVEASSLAETMEVGAAWTTHAPTRRPDGKPIRVKPQWSVQRVELLACEPEELLEWRLSYPSPKSNTRRVRIELEPAAGGTQLRIAFGWERGQGRRRSIRGWLMRPVYRLMIWMQLSTLGTGISRAFR